MKTNKRINRWELWEVFKRDDKVYRTLHHVYQGQNALERAQKDLMEFGATLSEDMPRTFVILDTMEAVD